MYPLLFSSRIPSRNHENTLSLHQELQAEIKSRDLVIEADKTKITELSVRVSELESTLEKLLADKAIQDETIKTLEVCASEIKMKFSGS